MKCSAPLLAQSLLNEVRRAVDVKSVIRQLPFKQRNSFVRSLVSHVEADKDDILAANRHDCEQFMKQRSMPTEKARPTFALTPSWMDRLLEGLDHLADTPDPLQVQRQLPGVHPSITVNEVAVPLGMIGVLSRLRPRIMLDAIAMCIKSGNVLLVDNGAMVSNTSRALLDSVHRAMTSVDIPLSAVVHVDETDERHTTNSTSQWLKMNDFIDVAIVCGSNKLYEYAAKNTTIPLIRSTGHVCTLYVDKEADFNVALDVVRNAKFQRVNATNAITNLLIHEEFEHASHLLDILSQQGVLVVGDAAVNRIFPAAALATEEDWIGAHHWTSNYHKLCVRMISRGVDEAVGFISTYGSGQSDGIISTNAATIEHFLQRVDSAVVYANASTRFSSGDCFGFGADLAIATSRLHCRGPVSLQCLTTKKFIVRATDMSKGAVRP